MAENSSKANKLVSSDLKTALNSCKICSESRKEYLSQNLSGAIPQTLKALANAGVETITGTGSGIGRPACLDLRDYTKAIILGDKSKKEKIEIKYSIHK